MLFSYSTSTYKPSSRSLPHCQTSFSSPAAAAMHREGKPSDGSDYQLQRRNSSENSLRRCNRKDTTSNLDDIPHLRSVIQRALASRPTDHTLWLRLASFEYFNGCYEDFRFILDRAVELFPTVDQLWREYATKERKLFEYRRVRDVFERWIAHQPPIDVWVSYAEFEIDLKEIERARKIYSRMVKWHPCSEAWFKFAEFELKYGNSKRTDDCYEHAMRLLEDEEQDMDLDDTDDDDIDETLSVPKQTWYEEEVKKNPLNHDAWLELIMLEESSGDEEKIRQAYKRAVANVPPTKGKEYWRDYIYVWIKYALFEELDAEDIDRTRSVYKDCLTLIPHGKFTFADIWILAAKFELRQKDLVAMRSILDDAITIPPKKKDKIFRTYVEIELQLQNTDGCRKICDKFIKLDRYSRFAWDRHISLEYALGEDDKARTLLLCALALPKLDVPYTMFKEYIEFEIESGEWNLVRVIFEMMLKRWDYLQVWLNYVRFEASAGKVDLEEFMKVGRQAMGERLQRSRTILGRALEHFKEAVGDEKKVLLQEWLSLEKEYGKVGGDAEMVKKRIELEVKKKRGFPYELCDANLELPENAHRCKKLKVEPTA